ncbi:helix-turn-helix domain-containing protein [Neoaquamicrobium sediminum]|uniref:helix-turn-helix domain-containing protein n=1 Tax=Neoaquamicrobium sediminum TaxID=1849104 RepID=UPI00156465F4|nr:helix-turn-helix domain-containing protein [Mesorhizobium sediminum]NRC54177.1 helix-turn-helix transcriptional regulator [Mesorhizobium sediminum]
MTRLQWAIIDALAVQPATAKMIQRSLETHFSDVNVSRVSASLGILRKEGVVKREKRPTGNCVFVRGESVRQFMTVWSINPKAVLPARQESLL